MHDDHFHDLSAVDDAGEDPGWDGGDFHDHSLDHADGEDHGHDADHGHDPEHDHSHDHDHDHGHEHGHDADHDHPHDPGPVHDWDGKYLHDIHRITLVGEEAGSDWPTQQGPQECAFTAELGVLHSLGHDVSEAEARELALSEGWLTEHGTSPEHMGHLMEAYGVEVDAGYEHSLSDLLDALKHGRKILVGLDGEEIWHPVHGPGGAPLELPNHAHVVCVTGCTVDDAGRTWVQVNDPAANAQPGYPVDVNDFLNAWADFGNFAVITRH